MMIKGNDKTHDTVKSVFFLKRVVFAHEMDNLIFIRAKNVQPSKHDSHGFINLLCFIM